MEQECLFVARPDARNALNDLYPCGEASRTQRTLEFIGEVEHKSEQLEDRATIDILVATWNRCSLLSIARRVTSGRTTFLLAGSLSIAMLP